MTTRQDVTFHSDGVSCAAWLYLPEADAPRPVIVLGHGLGGVREMRLDAFAERFSTAGYACLVFDYRHFGASGGEPRQLLDVGRQLTDWAAAIAHVRSLPEVDGARVILWGSSFGGGHVIEATARDGAIAATISQCPFTDGLASSLATDRRSTAKVSALALRDVAGSVLGRPPVMVALAGPPNSAALMTSADAEPGYLALVSEGSTFRNEVAARFALQIARYFPGRSARKVPGPILFCVCETDTVAPAKATLRHAAKAPRGEIKRYPYGHFDIYVGEAFERVVADQLAFLQRRVPVA